MYLNMALALDEYFRLNVHYIMLIMFDVVLGGVFYVYAPCRSSPIAACADNAGEHQDSGQGADGHHRVEPDALANEAVAVGPAIAVSRDICDITSNKFCHHLVFSPHFAFRTSSFDVSLAT